MDTRPRRRGGRLASLLPGLLVVAVLGAGGSSSLTADAQPAEQVVDLTVVHGGR